MSSVFALERNDLYRFKHCPFCGDDSIVVSEGDFETHVYCLNLSCDEDFDLRDIAEIKKRYPVSFKKWVENL